MRKAALLFVLVTGLGILAFPQIGGKHAFEFVNLPNSAGIAGVGGVNVSIVDQDLNLMYQNPALLNSQMDGKLSLNYVPYFANIKTSSLGYVRSYEKWGTFGVGVQYTDYGTMTWTDESGNDLGVFKPYDYYIYAGGSHTIGLYTLGASLKFASSKIQNSGAAAILADIGGVFKHPTKDLSIALTIKNIGMPIKKYVKGMDMSMPFDARVGISFKPQHLPARISLTAHHLQQLDIVYLDPTAPVPTDLEGNPIKQKKSLADEIGRHFILGMELILSKNFHIMGGYNYLRRRELRLQTKSGGAGFSLGAMIRIKSFELSFSRAFYHVAGGSNYLTLTTDVNRIFSNNKKNKVSE